VAACSGCSRSRHALPGIDAPRISQADFKKLVAANNVVIVDTGTRGVRRQPHAGALRCRSKGTLTWPEAYEKTVAYC
jgi:hypothetical protein